MKNRKAEARESNGSNTYLTRESTMNNNTPTQNKFQFNSTPSRRDLLEQTKLSRLQERKPIKPVTLPDLSFSDAAAAGCLACGGWLDADDTIQQSVKVCRKCLTQYACIDQAIDAASKRKRQVMLERFAAEVKR